MPICCQLRRDASFQRRRRKMGRTNGILTTCRHGTRPQRRSNVRPPRGWARRSGNGVPGSQKRIRLMRAPRARRSSSSAPIQTCQVQVSFGAPTRQHTPRRKEKTDDGKDFAAATCGNALHFSPLAHMPKDRQAHLR